MNKSAIDSFRVNNTDFLSTLESVLSKEDEKVIREESREKQLKYEYKINKSVSYSSVVDHVVDLLLNLNKSAEEVVDDLSKLFRTGRTFLKNTALNISYFYRYLFH